MIFGEFEVWPSGYRIAASQLVRFKIWTSACGKFHEYRIDTGQLERPLRSGTLPKTRSGHGNILHLLKDILNDIDLENIPVDYFSVRTKDEDAPSKKEN